MKRTVMKPAESGGGQVKGKRPGGVRPCQANMGSRQLEAAENTIARQEEKLRDAQKKLEDSEKELADGWEEYEENRAEACG